MSIKRREPGRTEPPPSQRAPSQALSPDLDGASSETLPFEQEIESLLGQALPRADAESTTKRVMQVIARQIVSGPIPDPQTFHAYDSVLPGAADRILAMAEREQAHRIAWETTAIRAEARNATLGPIRGFAALALLVVGALGALSLGYAVVAALFVGTTALGLIPAFIKGRGLFGWFGRDGEGDKKSQPVSPSRKK